MRAPCAVSRSAMYGDISVVYADPLGGICRRGEWRIDDAVLSCPLDIMLNRAVESIFKRSMQKFVKANPPKSR
jgi:hypothetical protein